MLKSPKSNTIHTLSKEDTSHYQSLDTKSAMIRYLNSIGMDRSQITTELSNYFVTIGHKPIRYQHVRNILITPIKSSI